MSGFRADAALALAVALLWAQPAAAQTIDPAPLAAPGDDWLADPAPRPGRIDVGELKAPDPEAVGLLDERQGGFGPRMWVGSNAGAVRRLIPMLPAASPSPALRALAHRLLVSAAPPPDGAAGQTPSLVELRATRLYAMGELDSVAALLKSVPAAQVSPALARLRVDTLLLLGRLPDACAGVARLPDTDSRLTVFCALATGRQLEANMGIDLLRESKEADPAFLAAAEAMSGTPPPRIDKIPAPLSPVHLAIFRAAKMALPAEAGGQPSPPWLRAVAEGEANPPEMRLVAAERAEAIGLYDAVQLRRIYDTLAGEPGTKPPADSTPRGRALSLRAVFAEPVGPARAALIARTLTAAAERGGFAASARLYAPLIVDFSPSPDTAPVAATFARAMIAAGKPEAAAPWLALARATPTSTPTPDPAAQALDPLARLVGLGVAAGAPLVPLAPAGLSPEAAGRRAVLVLSLLQGLGEKIPAALWAAQLDGPALAPVLAPRPVLSALARSAAEQGRVGETVLLALVMLGDTPLDKVDPDLLGLVLGRLRGVGLEREARALAVEAALAGGW
jgi:hypothetical protein